jgi:hypothetical protein
MNENTFAFPHEITHLQKPLTAGMTLRDYFAAKAMQAFISAYPCQAIDREDGGIPTDAESISRDAYEMADSMLKAREE